MQDLEQAKREYGYDDWDEQAAIGEQMLAAARKPNRLIGEDHQAETKRLWLTSLILGQRTRA